MKIYQCKSQDTSNLVPILEELGMSYEETLEDGAAMARVAERARDASGMNHVVVPLSECLMTACLGTAITWDPELGDRVSKEVFSDWSEAESFRPESIRREMLDPLFEAVRILEERGAKVVVGATGPIALLSGLLPTEAVYRAMPKRKEPFPRLLGIVEDFISEYIARVDALRPELIYLADSVGSLDLVGPRLFRQVSGPSYLRVLERAEGLATPIYMCPKNMTSLFSVGFLERAADGNLCALRKVPDRPRGGDGIKDEPSLIFSARLKDNVEGVCEG